MQPKKLSTLGNNLKMQITRYQSGQAALESTIVVIVFLLLMLAGNLFQQVEEGTQEFFSSNLAFAVSAARGATLTDSVLQVMHDQNSNRSDKLERKMMNELKIVDDWWIRSGQAKTLILPKAIASVFIDDHMKISNSVYIKGKISHAGSPGQVTMQLRKTNHIWSSPASHTEKLIRYTKGSSHLVDLGWKRKYPKLDLLKGWQDSEPFK